MELLVGLLVRQKYVASVIRRLIEEVGDHNLKQYTTYRSNSLFIDHLKIIMITLQL